MKKWMYNTLIIVFLLIFLFSAGAIIWYFVDSRVQQGRYQELSQLKPSIEHTLPALPGGDVPPETQPPSPLIPVTDPETGETTEILPSFLALYEMNSDIIGWLSIPAVEVDYPVMHTPDDPEYYLRRNFDKKKQTRGCLFLEATADPFAPSDNLTIYGHKMRDGTMFGQLEKFKKKEFWQENPYIYFSTLQDTRVYEIIGVFKTTASAGEGFAYHLFVDGDQAEFDAFVSQVKVLSMYDTGIEPEYGDKLLTLSTCDKSLYNGRFVVVARQIGG